MGYAIYLRNEIDKVVNEGSYDPVNVGVVSEHYDTLSDFIRNGNLLGVYECDTFFITMLELIGVSINVNYGLKLVSYREFIVGDRETKIGDIID